ncbi:hypothetical protein [Fodinicurvata sediminis]|uniref:hypothetical protein n=4 Tax=Fodinicurvata sediminis TaxID=1121832 RepID=UPI0003B380F3|nr:hypothetical protein [Fodinicurvata sediminis]
MSTDSAALRAKLSKLEALFAAAGTAGERAAAGAAMERVQARLDATPEPEVELKFSFPDSWTVRLFVAICRKHGLRPYRYRRQRHTTVMVQAREAAFERVVWPEFNDLHQALVGYFEEVTDHLIEDALSVAGDSDTLPDYA